MKSRKILLAFLSVVIVLVALLGFSGCDEQHTHSFSNWESVSEPTCTSIGLQKRTCECSYAEYDTVAALQHTPVTDAAIDATCTTDGKTEGSHCEACGTILTVQNTVSAHGHRCDDVTVLEEATCNAEGCKRFSCTNDGCSYYYDESYSQKELSAPEIMKSAMEYVGCLQSFDSGYVRVKYSTAIVISNDGKILTSYAALDNAYYATFTLGEKNYDIVKVLAYDTKANLAVLKIDATSLPCATICDSAPVTGETVYSIGNAMGVSLAINEGIVSNASMKNGNKIFIQHDAILMSGYGGGPLLNRFGEVIGVNFGTYEDAHFRLAIPITQLRALNYDNPISMEENFKITYTIREYIVNQIKEYATKKTADTHYFEHTSSKFSFALGYNESDGSIFVESEINLDSGYQLRIHIPLEMVKDESYEYHISFTDGKFHSDITGILDPTIYADPSIEGSSMLTYETFLGRYWEEQDVMDACSYGVYETLRWLSYCFNTYFIDITLKDTFGFTAVSYEYDDTALEKLNSFVEANGTFNPETGVYMYSASQNISDVTFMYGINYCPASEGTASKTILTIYCSSSDGEDVAVAITLNTEEAGNLIEMFSGFWDEEIHLEALNKAWGYIDISSFTDRSEIFCYDFEGNEEYEDKFLLVYSSLISYLLTWTDSVVESIEPALSIRDLGFLFYFLP